MGLGHLYASPMVIPSAYCISVLLGGMEEESGPERGWPDNVESKRSHQLDAVSRKATTLDSSRGLSHHHVPSTFRFEMQPQAIAWGQDALFHTPGSCWTPHLSSWSLS